MSINILRKRSSIGLGWWHGRTNSVAPSPGAERLNWYATLCELVVEGTSIDESIRRLGIPTGEIEAAGRAAADLSRHPLFAIARLNWTRLKCRDWLLRAYADVTSADEGSPPVTFATDSPSKEHFRGDYYCRNRALVVKGFAASWPALHLWTPDYLKACCGDMDVDVMTNRLAAPVSRRNTSPTLATRMRFGDYVDLVYATDWSNDFYLVSRNRFFERIATRCLLDDLEPTPIVNTSADGGGVKMWFGPAGTVTPIHHDDKNNFIVQIVGRKTVRLYPSFLAEQMRQIRPWYGEVDPQDHTSDHSAGATDFILEPGDGLFIPVGWWHALTAVERSITLAFVDFGLPNEYGKPF